MEIPVGKRSRFDIILEDAVHLLDDVVVTGYQTLSKERATGSFDIIDKAQIQKPAGKINKINSRRPFPECFLFFHGSLLKNVNSCNELIQLIICRKSDEICGNFINLHPNIL